MKILFLLTQDLESPSGLGRYWPLGRELSKLGHTVTIAALHSNYHSLEKKVFSREGVQVRYVAPMHVRKVGNRKSYYSFFGLIFITMRATLALCDAALRIPADIVHIGKPHPMNSIAGLAAKYLRRSCLFLDYDDYEVGSNRTTGRWQRWVLALFENGMPNLVVKVTTHASFLRNRLLSQGISDKKIVTLPNGVDYDRFAILDQSELASLRSSLGLSHKRVVAFIGSLSAHAHAVDLLMQAFRLVVQEIPEATLLIVGGGERFTELQEFSQDLGINAATVFCGRVPAPKVNLYYHLAEVSVDPVNDTDVARGRFPVKLFESWAAGTPFVTADVGDRRLLLEHPLAGLLADPGDALSLSRRIIQILENPALAEELRRNGFDRARSFDWKILAKGLENVYLDSGKRA